MTRKHARPVKGERERAQRERERVLTDAAGSGTCHRMSGVETGIQVGRSAAPSPILHGLPLTRSVLLTDTDELLG